MLLLIQNNCECDGFSSWIPWLFGAFILGTIFGWLLNKILTSDNSKEELNKLKAELDACKKEQSNSKNKNTLAGASSFTNSKTASSSASLKTSTKPKTDNTVKKETSKTTAASLTAKKETSKKPSTTKSNNKASASKTTKKETSKKTTRTVVAKDVTAKDDLTKIEGIGPKIQGLLYNDGVWTWKQLAATAVSDIQKILDKAGPRYRVHKPGSWPKQAGMAASGEWDKLKKWQDNHKGGIE